MKSRKILTIFIVVIAMMAAMALSAGAVDLIVDKDYVESTSKTVSGYDCWHTGGDLEDGLLYMFDGITDCAGGWYIGNGFALPAGESATITFVEEFDVTSVLFYGWSNWSSCSIVFYDAEGNETKRCDLDGWQSTQGVPTDLEVSGKVKSMTIKTLSSKGLRNHTYTEFVITANHEHRFDQFDRVTKAPGCVEEGTAIYHCFCGESGEVPVDPTGNHTIVDDSIYFKDGFTNPGFKGSACITCSTQNNIITEIGPLFQTLGYSASENGKNGVSLTILVDYENIALYNSLSAFPLEFGVVAATRAAFDDGNPLYIGDEGLTKASDTIVTKDFTDAGYSTISYKLQGFSNDHKGTQLIVSAYIFDGTSIYYLGEETTGNVTTTSFNEIMGIVDTTVEAVVPSNEE